MHPSSFYLMTALVLLNLQLAGAQNPADLVEISDVNPNIQLDIRYATDHNFLGQAVYPQARCFVRYAVAVRLDTIQHELESMGLGLKLFDGYRPLSVQKKMWEIMPDNRYVADPAKGSRHNRGAAVDLTLVRSDGSEPAMPTPFDDFSMRAAHGFMNLPNEIKIHRWILRTIMEKHGFKAISSEWWHYDLIGWQNYPLMDLTFAEIDSLNRHKQK